MKCEIQIASRQKAKSMEPSLMAGILSHDVRRAQIFEHDTQHGSSVVLPVAHREISTSGGLRNLPQECAAGGGISGASSVNGVDQNSTVGNSLNRIERRVQADGVNAVRKKINAGRLPAR